jgi:chemotaxis protein MotB
MGAPSNAAPVIIKRKKVVQGGGHHGGAWKVAYADFVTAMMAFFMLMWLLNATTEKQRKGIADYFSPTIPLSRVSGGGDGSFGGESVFSEDQIAQSGTGASSLKPTVEKQAAGQTGTETSEDKQAEKRFAEEAKAIEEALMGIGGESMISKEALRHIVTRLTDEGLIVELSDTAEAALFEEGTAAERAMTRELAGIIARVFALSSNDVAVNGHVRARSKVLRENPAWDLSSDRAMRFRVLLEASGLAPARIARVAGFGERQPKLENAGAPGNNRLEVILLRTVEGKETRPRAR